MFTSLMLKIQAYFPLTRSIKEIDVISKCTTRSVMYFQDKQSFKCSEVDTRLKSIHNLPPFCHVVMVVSCNM